VSRAAPVVPPGPEAASLAEARALAAQCRRCELWRGATQTVFGEGPASATVVLVGEQPGDKEDLQGHPFVGPAGGMLDRALAEAEIDRAQAYVTNAVKHFKNVPRGRKRIHQRPDRHEIEICRWWLDLELSFVRPRLVVALGASAARALFLRTVTITRERGRPLPFRDGLDGFVTVHPSFILRQRTDEDRRREYAALVADLRRVAALIRA
jgi:uracil-DNA glycosylase family protein